MPSEIDEGGIKAMKRWVSVFLVLIFLTGCGQPEEKEETDGQFEKEICRWEREVAQTAPQTLALQEDLARWYNYRLQSGGECADAYHTILYYTDGILGTVEFPAIGLRLPIYHGTASPAIGHDPATPFPIGETGNHSVLVTERSLALEPGDSFSVHILGRTLTYQVVAIRREPDTTAVPDVDYCSILMAGEHQILGIRCPSASRQ